MDHLVDDCDPSPQNRAEPLWRFDEASIEEIEKEEDGSRVGFLPGGMENDSSRDLSITLKETSVNAYTNKDSWSGSIEEDDVSTRWNRISHGSNTFFPLFYSCFNPSHGKMLIFFFETDSRSRSFGWVGRREN